MEDLSSKELLINLHTHFFETREFDRANFTVRQFLSINKALSEMFNKKIITSCGSHNSTTQAKLVFEELKKYPEYSKSVEVIPQSEFTVDVSRISKCKNFP